VSSSASLVWFRLDLRLADHPALTAAIRQGGPVIPVFIWSPEEEQQWAPGGASRWWLHHSLNSLKKSLRDLGSDLLIRRGPTLKILQELTSDFRVQSVYWNRRYEPLLIERDRLIKQTLTHQGLHVESFNGSLLREPWEMKTKTGGPFQVFTPFWKACLSSDPPAIPLRAPVAIKSPDKLSRRESVEDLNLLPRIPWDQEFYQRWQPGEQGAWERLSQFVPQAVKNYKDQRDFPGVAGTSCLSPHLHFGEISPRQVWQAALNSGHSREAAGPKTFLAELGWREFAHHILFHFPQTTDAPLRERFAQFPWQPDRPSLKRWQRGQTGYPIVDAGMRELWTTGWMHNRVRMIVGSFLTKDLLIPWQSGAHWFWDTLVDADLASNSLGWQWVSGCGADAAPYFRIFNPVSQGEKFDPRGDYVRRWVPELAELPDRWIHRPWEAPEQVLRSAGIELGKHYPLPMVDHGEARQAALEAFQKIKAESI
jgi:deoxyribodipyrimidine photo-lyase